MYIHTTDYRYKHIYDINTLKSYSDHAERDIQRCLETIEAIRKYQAGIYEHVQEVLNTPMQKIVCLTRRTSGNSNKVTYHVQLEVRPVIDRKHVDGSAICGTKHEQKNFSGIERHIAIKYAEELAKKNNCSIEKWGFPKRRNEQ